LLRWGVSYHAVKFSNLVLVGPRGNLIEGEGKINIAGYRIHNLTLEVRLDLNNVALVHKG
tara:strand:+ start:319 stop:498 length:180 start_codon:yes stop_codon:yes gene_type:complete